MMHMQTAEDYFQSLAKGLTFETDALIGGRFVKAESGREFNTINPATGRLLANITECGQAEVNSAVKSARAAFERGHWAGASRKHRKKVLLQFADLVEANIETLAIAESQDSGKPIYHALLTDLPAAIESLRWYAEAADKRYDQVSLSAPDVVGMVAREPTGVVGAVLPWNFPILHAAWKIGPSLASGNSIVIKPARQTSLTTLLLGKLALQAGIPDGVLNIVTGYGETVGRAMGRHHDIDCISFTGAPEVGRLFMRYSADSNLKRTVLECNGKSPTVVLPGSSELGKIAQQIANDVLIGLSENCNAGSRLIVHRSVKEELLAKIQSIFTTWEVGSPLTPLTRVGPLIESRHLRRSLKLIDIAQCDGAELVYGGIQANTASGGNFIVPAILDKVRPNTVVAHEEIYCPALCITEFDKVEECLQIANNSSGYSQASMVYTNNLDLAHRVAQAMRTNNVSINCFVDGETMPFGAREKALTAHDQFTQTKTVQVQRF